MTSSSPSPDAFAVLAEVAEYRAAQRLVDRLSDAGFPVRSVRIVGTGIHTVEQVTGRMTTGRRTLIGTASGAWFGLLVGLLVGLFATDTRWPRLLLSALILGALWGAVLGFLMHWLTDGRRDFSSVTSLEAERYEVQVAAPDVAQARRVLDAG